MADIKYGPTTAWADLFASADMQNLANNGGKLSSQEIDNSSDHHLYADISFKCVTSTWAVSANGVLSLFLLPIGEDGSTYPNTADGTAATDYPGSGYLWATLTFRQGTFAHSAGAILRPIPPVKFKAYLRNGTGAALPNSASNMTMKIQRYSEVV